MQTIEQIDARIRELETLKDDAGKAYDAAKSLCDEKIGVWANYNNEISALKLKREVMCELKASWKGSEALPV